MVSIYVVMGVSGCGKTTVGKLVAIKMQCDFVDADDYHSVDSVNKMRNGIALNDEDRKAWLENLTDIIASYIKEGKRMVLACSALKKRYRDQLSMGKRDEIVFIYLQASFDAIYNRLEKRKDHYMSASLLQSQFDALEEPDKHKENIILIDGEKSTGSILDEFLRLINISSE